MIELVQWLMAEKQKYTAEILAFRHAGKAPTFPQVYELPIHPTSISSNGNFTGFVTLFKFTTFVRKQKTKSSQFAKYDNYCSGFYLIRFSVKFLSNKAHRTVLQKAAKQNLKNFKNLKNFAAKIHKSGT